MHRRTILTATLGIGHAAAQTPAGGFPNHPLRLVVPFAAGGGSDLMGRATSQKIAELLGQPIVIENRSGGNGTVGAVAVAQAKPDGYTLLLATGSEMALKPLLEANLPYDPERDFDPVVMLGITPVVIAVNPNVPVRSIAELIALARARPGQINISNPGSGSIMHLTAALLALRVGIEVQHVPYRGAAPAVADAVAGTVQAVVSGLPPVLAQAREGRLRILAVSTPRRSAVAPEVPTLDEAGIPGFDMSNAVGLVVPRGTPPDIVAMLNATANRALQDPEVRRIFLSSGAEPLGSTVSGHAAFIAEERERFRTWVRLTGVRME